MNANQTTHVSAYPPPNQLHYAVLALLFAAFTVYGSVTPLHLHPMPFTEAAERFREVLDQPIAIKSRSDWLANFLLLLPLGFLLMGALCCDSPRQLAGLVVPLVLIACIALAVFVEFGHVVKVYACEISVEIACDLLLTPKRAAEFVGEIFQIFGLNDLNSSFTSDAN